MTDSHPDGLSQPTVSVVLMAYNESPSVRQVLRAVQQVLARMETSYELIVIDDGSTDGTRELVESEAARGTGIVVVSHDANQGLGAVYRSGFAAAHGTYVTFLPADGQFPPENIQVLFDAVEDHDAVFGFVDNRRDGLFATALSAVERGVCRVVLGPMPRFQGIFMLRREVLAELTLLSRGRGWGIVMELAARIHQGGYRARSVRTSVIRRTTGTSKVRNVRTIVANARQLLRLGATRFVR